MEFKEHWHSNQHLHPRSHCQQSWRLFCKPISKHGSEKERDSAPSLVSSRKAATRAASDRLRATKEMEDYLHVAAPFDGTITDRFVHPGMLVESGGHTPLLKLQQTGHLRLTIPVPENYVGHIVHGTLVSFHVASQPGRTYSVKIARISNALDSQNRTMMVELDAYNSEERSLAPGMYPTIDWPVNSAEPLLLVPNKRRVHHGADFRHHRG